MRPRKIVEVLSISVATKNEQLLKSPLFFFFYPLSKLQCEQQPAEEEEDDVNAVIVGGDEEVEEDEVIQQAVEAVIVGGGGEVQKMGRVVVQEDGCPAVIVEEVASAQVEECYSAQVLVYDDETYLMQDVAEEQEVVTEVAETGETI